MILSGWFCLEEQLNAFLYILFEWARWTINDQCTAGQIVDRFGMLSVINFKTYNLTLNVMGLMENYYLVTISVRPRVNKKPLKFIFEYWVFSQKSYLNTWRFEKNPYLHT